MALETFPDVDFPLWGNETEPSIGSNKPAPPFTLGVVAKDIGDGVGNLYEGAKKMVSGVYWNLILGVAVIGIIAVVVLAMGSRFARTVEGG